MNTPLNLVLIYVVTSKKWMMGVAFLEFYNFVCIRPAKITFLSELDPQETAKIADLL